MKKVPKKKKIRAVRERKSSTLSVSNDTEMKQAIAVSFDMLNARLTYRAGHFLRAALWQDLPFVIIQGRFRF